MIHFFLPGAESELFDDYMARWGHPIANLLVRAPIESLPHRDRHPTGTWILSGLDRLGPATLKHLAALADAATAAGIRVLNHPERTLQRYDLLARLHERGWNDFRAWRLEELRSSAVRFPVFLRDEATHEGSLSPLLRSRLEVAGWAAMLTAAGYPRRRLIAIEFRDTSRQGVFRKYSTFIVGERIMAKSLSMGPEWVMKREDGHWTLPEMQEELDYVLTNPHEKALREIFRLANVDYGRVDYAMDGDRLVIWEINLYPTMARSRTKPERNLESDVTPVWMNTRTHFHSQFVDSFRAIDTPGGEEVTLQVDPELVAAARAEKRVRRRVDRIRDAVAPLRPMLRPVKVLGWKLAGLVDRKRASAQDAAPGATPK